MSKESVKVFGSKETQLQIKNLIKSGKKLKPLFNEMVDAFYKIQKNVVFRNGAASGPGKYKDLKGSTKKQKLRKYNLIYPVLFASGELMKSFERGGDDNITKITDRHAEAGTKKKYSIYLQNGTKFMPARPPILPGILDKRTRLSRPIFKPLNNYYERVMK